MMQITEYGSLKRQIYKFTSQEILDALSSFFKIRITSQNHSFDLFDTEQDIDRTMAVLTVTYENTNTHGVGVGRGGDNDS